MIDNFRHKGLRKQLIEVLKTKGIQDVDVLKAISEIPRHLFLDSSFLEFAYQDKAFPIGEGQTISQPYTVARQTELLEVKKGDKILEIGTGSGYQAAVLYLLGAKVFTIERHKILYEKTKIILNELKYITKTFYGDGYKGLPTFAPFDKIIVTCGAPYIPQPLFEQLKTNGIMVIPLGNDIQTMITIKKISDTEFIKNEHGSYRFVPMVEKKVN